jgi:small GTP-binding protein
MQLCDTAGQERFHAIPNSFYRGVQGIIFVYDVTNYQSFTEIRTWFDTIKEHFSDKNIPKLLVGNKVDQSNKVVTSENGRRLAESLGMEWTETSAKQVIQVNEAFESLAKMILSRPELLNEPSTRSTTVKLEADKPARRCNCC